MKGLSLEGSYVESRPVTISPYPPNKDVFLLLCASHIWHQRNIFQRKGAMMIIDILF